MPALTLVSLLERYLVLETAMPRGDNRKRPSAHLYSMGLTPVSLLESKGISKNCLETMTLKSDHLHIYSLRFTAPSQFFFPRKSSKSNASRRRTMTPHSFS
jgi:hypothetical protein